MPPLPANAAADWLTTFVPFSLAHWATITVCAVAMIAAAVFGRWHRGTVRERRLRMAWATVVIAFQTYYTFWWLLPANIDISTSMPLQLCDLGGFVAGFAMATGKRWLRAVLYFWGIGLSTQAFATPILREGFADIKFWHFWIGHTMIVGSAVYDIVVGGFRPTRRDFSVAGGISQAYVAVVFVLDWVLGVNYAYLGNMRPENPTIIDQLGPWPWRVLIVFAIAWVDFLVLWLIWPVAGRLLRSKVSPTVLRCVVCGADLSGRSPQDPCPVCEARKANGG